MAADAYYFGFRQIIPKPPGRWVLCGPFATYEDAKADKMRSQEYDCQLSEVFHAADTDEANARIARMNEPD